MRFYNRNAPQKTKHITQRPFKNRTNRNQILNLLRPSARQLQPFADKNKMPYIGVIVESSYEINEQTA